MTNQPVPQCCWVCRHMTEMWPLPSPRGICGFVDLLVLPVAVKQVLWREVLLTEGTDCPCFERKEGE